MVMAWRHLYTKDEHDNLKYTNMMGQYYEKVRGHSMFNTLRGHYSKYTQKMKI